MIQNLSFQPFGNGKDICAGRHFARDAVLLFVADVTAQFDLLSDAQRRSQQNLIPRSECMKFSNGLEKDMQVCPSERWR